jgi:hypothetical protein
MKWQDTYVTDRVSHSYDIFNHTFFHTFISYFVITNLKCFKYKSAGNVGSAKVLCIYVQIFIFQTSIPTQYFWYRITFIISEDISSPEAFNWKTALALVVAWVLVYMCMIKGIPSSGKVSS